MCVALATMGKYWSLPDGGGLVCPGGGEGSYSSFIEKKERRPIVVVDQVYEEKKEVNIEIEEIYHD